jgi:hypothetical protein
MGGFYFYGPNYVFYNDGGQRLANERVIYCNCTGLHVNINLAQEQLLSQHNDIRLIGNNGDFLAVLNGHSRMGGTTYQKRPIEKRDMVERTLLTKV